MHLSIYVAQSRVYSLNFTATQIIDLINKQKIYSGQKTGMLRNINSDLGQHQTQFMYPPLCQMQTDF